MGLERMSYILQGKINVFETDLFEPIIERIRSLSEKQSTFSERIVADHVRAACFVMVDGVSPSNEGRGYVLRRLIRRATLHADRLAMRSEVGQLVDDVVAVMGEAYPDLIPKKDSIRAGINQEAARFQRTLNEGMERFERIVAKHPKLISGPDAFLLHDTFGFPIDLTRELAAERDLEVDEEGFRAAMAAQKERSRHALPTGWVTAAVDAGRRRQIARHHSATHLLHKALRETLGDQIVQKGSWVGPDHTTFDIPLNRALKDDELKRINIRVMEKIREALPFHESQKPYKEAVAQGAMHLFDEKYGDVVRVVCFGDWTCELCGGTHVANTADIGPAVIVSESSIGSGVRRIDMVVGEAADGLIWRERKLLSELAKSFNTSPPQLPERVESLRSQLKEAERRLKVLSDQLRTAKVKGGNGLAVKSGKVPFVTETVEASTADELAAYADRYLEMVKSGVVTVVAGDQFVIKVSKDLTPEYDAARLASLLGKGGGRPHLARGTLKGTAAEAFKRIEEALT